MSVAVQFRENFKSSFENAFKETKEKLSEILARNVVSLKEQGESDIIESRT